MITWMQRHKKWLIITIWISTIAFVGAGFVGWGQYSYGDKAGAVAKVGNVEISMGELQKTYSRIYAQYNQMFRGNFDEEKAKQFGLQRQALQQLTQQALILNLTQEYNLEVSDAELLKELQQQKYFFNEAGVFDKEIYKSVLSRNNLTMKEYEDDLKKSLLIQKTLAFFPVKENKNETKIMQTLSSIADKLNYKVLDPSLIDVDTSDEKLKAFWETQKNNYKTDISYKVTFVIQKQLSKTFDQQTIEKYYNENKTHFLDKDGKILPLEKATNVVTELNDKATKDAALRKYIAFKKGKLNEEPQEATLSQSANPYTPEVLEKLSEKSLASPYLKPILVGKTYYIFKLEKINPSEVKSFQEAKRELLPLYIATKSKEQILELAKNSISTFKGVETSYITSKDANKLTLLSDIEANEFLSKLFTSSKRRDFVQLSSGKIVLYNIMEQKMLKNEETNPEQLVTRLKSALFDEGLIKTLKNKYQTEIYIEGL